MLRFSQAGSPAAIGSGEAPGRSFTYTLPLTQPQLQSSASFGSIFVTSPNFIWLWRGRSLKTPVTRSSTFSPRMMRVTVRPSTSSVPNCLIASALLITRLFA